MFKAFLLVTLVVGAHGGLLSSAICTPAELITAVDSLIKDFQKQASDGLVVKPPGFDEAVVTPLVTFPGGLTLTAGIVALPTNFTCGQPEGSIIDKLSCLIGAQDCTYVHNKYGGKCGYSANPVANTTQAIGKVFVCNDVRPTDFDFSNVNDARNCGPLLGGLLDPVLNLAINQILRARFTLDLCPPNPGGSPRYNSIGCNSDCRNNHQYISGNCTTGNPPTAEFPTEVNSGFQCICSL